MKSVMFCPVCQTKIIGRESQQLVFGPRNLKRVVCETCGNKVFAFHEPAGQHALRLRQISLIKSLPQKSGQEVGKTTQSEIPTFSIEFPQLSRVERLELKMGKKIGLLGAALIVASLIMLVTIVLVSKF